MSAFIQPNSYVVLRLPSDALKVVEIIPNTSISIGKFGAFPANLLVGRPLYTTYEIHEAQNTGSSGSTVRLRIVPAADLNRDAQFDLSPSSENDTEAETGVSTPSGQLENEEAIVVKDNRLTIDDASRQTLSMHEIEELKKAVTGNGREIIEKIMSAHKNLDEKTNFSLAKYTLRKAKKYLRRFTVLPMDVCRLAQYLTANREASRILELREESLGLLNAWSNAHVTPQLDLQSPAGKWLVIDDTAGIVVASLAEKLGILYKSDTSDTGSKRRRVNSSDTAHEIAPRENGEEAEDVEMANAEPLQTEVFQSEPSSSTTDIQQNYSSRNHQRRHPYHPSISSNNTIYLLHPASQPNMSMLKYFGYSTTHPDTTHPLSKHLLTLSWLQLLAPDHDSTYEEPETFTQAQIDEMKTSKRSSYYRKRRRWLRCKNIVDSARMGEFDGLICATTMIPTSILKHLVPLIKGGGHVVLYSPTIEPLEKAVDLYSKERKAAFIAELDSWRSQQEMSADTPEGMVPLPVSEKKRMNGHAEHDHLAWKKAKLGVTHLPDGFTYDEADFPVDPRLLLGCSIHSSRARQWQVLPGRTHPVMTSRGGGEGFILAARRVLPVEGKVEARGKFSKKRKAAPQ